ncbi:Phage shock protein A [Caulifigura coniformis]|uniref:Phage shock protein A n=1 Tax=Caulifigura coniformis TaxID=2527983 RepID=A0A517SMR5_9PLAN|nr:PspA/IM30 family protein [Caulifigura coniformis]QDT57417.1 Phage shock protein A [Caulifigura coniformis]
MTMPYFSRLTDIVTCNLTLLLKESENPQEALEQIIREMKDGVAGAHRSAATAARNLEKIEAEIAEQKSQIDGWMTRAKAHLERNDENQARLALMRKKEVEALIAGLEQQRGAAAATCRHLQTTQAALEARLHDAERRRAGLPGDDEAGLLKSSPVEVSAGSTWNVDDELAALKKEVGK